MKQNSKRLLKRFLLPLVSTRPCQPIFWLMYRLSLVGMNIGGGSEIGNSGELAVLRYAARILTRRHGLAAFDVGANVGDWTLAAARTFGPNAHFHCFEPSQATREVLIRNLASLPNVTIYAAGVGARAESASLLRPEQTGCASLYARASHGALRQHPVVAESISLVRIDEFCRQHGIESIDFLKLDIEGHEPAALTGCGELLKNGRIRFIQFEFGGCNIDSRTYFHDFWDMLSPNYDLFRILQRGIYPVRRYHELIEIFTTTNYLAVWHGLPPSR